MRRRLIPLTAEQLKVLRTFADGQPHKIGGPAANSPYANLVRRNLLTRSPVSGPGFYKITQHGLAAVRERR